MSASNYEACLKQMLVYEGGYSNHPRDPGGVTLEGVIQTRYNEYRRAKGLPQKALKPEMRRMPEWIRERNEIYRKYYWNPVQGDALHDGVDLAVFDYAVNSGPGRALPHFKPFRDLPPVQAIKKLCARRLAFLRALGTWSVFGKGWGPRVANVEAVGVKMALKAQQKPAAEVKKTLQAESIKAGEAKASNAAAGGGSVAAGGTTAHHADAFVAFDWLSVSVGALLIVAVIFVGYRIYVNHQRQKAYADAAATP